MGTQQWHALDHLCDAVREVGDLVYLHAGLSESSHKNIRAAHCLIFKRGRWVMRGFIEKHNNENTRYTQRQQEPEMSRKLNRTK